MFRSWKLNHENLEDVQYQIQKKFVFNSTIHFNSLFISFSIKVIEFNISLLHVLNKHYLNKGVVPIKNT